MKFKHRHYPHDDGLFEMALGAFFGFGVGLCLVGLAAGLVIAFIPQWIPPTLLSMFGIAIG
jgi:hypothetical protein